MMRWALAFAAFAAAGTAAGAAEGQAAPTPQDGAIQMQPLNALKPQTAPVVPEPGTDATGLGADPGTTPGIGAATGSGSGTDIGTGTGVTVQGLGQTGSAPPPSVPGQITTTTTTTEVADAPGGVVRWLDKISGTTADLTLARGQSGTEGRITVTLDDCRYPKDDPASNAYAYLTIRDSLVSNPIFKGWMIASSPALNPLDSARYDVWVLRCTNS